MSFHVYRSLRNRKLYNQSVTTMFLWEAAESRSSTQINYFKFRIYYGGGDVVLLSLINTVFFQEFQELDDS